MRKHALVVGFDPDRGAAYAELVSAEGLEPVVVQDGAEARALLHSKGPPGLTVTEISLTRADGFSLIGELRRLAPAGRSPAVVVSGVREFLDTAENMKDQLGIAEILSAGTPPEEIHDAIRRALIGQESSAPAMPPPREPREERTRLAQIAAMGLVDHAPPDEELQKLVEETARVFDVPIALLSLVLEHRQWFKAHYGLAGDLLAQRGTPREISFCRHVVEGNTVRPLVIPDATVHPAFENNALVREGLVGSYAGAPLITPEGNVLGTLCIIDTKPLTIGPEQVDHLQAYARRAAGELELRSKTRTAVDDPTQVQVLLKDAADGHTGVLLMDAKRKIVFANQAFADMFSIPLERLMEMNRADMILRVAKLSDRPNDCVRALLVLPRGPYAVRHEFLMHRPRRRRVRWVARPVPLPEGVGQVDMFTEVDTDVQVASG